jgi:hypothetical protein
MIDDEVFKKVCFFFFKAGQLVAHTYNPSYSGSRDQEAQS